MRPISLVRTLVAIAALIAFTGCGGSGSTSTDRSSVTPSNAPTPSSSSTVPPPGAPAAALRLEANPAGALSYSTKSLTAKRGIVTLAFTNISPLPHNVTVASSRGQVLGATQTFRGGVRTLTLELTPGTYKFYCSVPGHRAAGMHGTLVVR